MDPAPAKQDRLVGSAQSSSQKPKARFTISTVMNVHTKSRLATHKRRDSTRRSIVRKSDSEPQFNSRYLKFLPDHVARQLQQTAKALVKPGLGILAADDSERQINLKLKDLKLPASENNRGRYHELFLGAPYDSGLSTFLSGVLVREESTSQALYKGKKLLQMIKGHKLKLGFRVDEGVIPLTGTLGEYATRGLDQVGERLKRLKDKGADFALWRCVYKITEDTPSQLAVIENSRILARFASCCQAAGLVPIVSPEVLQDGSHGNEKAQEVMKMILTSLTKALLDYHVYLEGTLVRVTAAGPGVCFKGNHDVTKVAATTIKTVNECLPPAIGGVLLASEHSLCRSVSVLNAVQTCAIRKAFFWTFCFSHVIQDGLVNIWAGQDKHLNKATAEMIKRLKCCSLASFGQLSESDSSFFIQTQFKY